MKNWYKNLTAVLIITGSLFTPWAVQALGMTEAMDMIKKLGKAAGISYACGNEATQTAALTGGLLIGDAAGFDRSDVEVIMLAQAVPEQSKSFTAEQCAAVDSVVKDFLNN